MAANDARITFYTNHHSPNAHRIDIVLRELGLQYEEVEIDLGKPREPWFLEINPKGQVPTIRYNDEILAESIIIAQFLADLNPSHLLPPPSSFPQILARARIQFFIDAWNNKVGKSWYTLVLKEEEEQEKMAKEVVELIKKEIEPLLVDAGPFFKGSQKITLAEAIVGPMILFIYNLINGGIMPKSLKTGFDALPNFSKWAAVVVEELSKSPTWDEEKVLAGAHKKLAQLKEQVAAAKAAAAK